MMASEEESILLTDQNNHGRVQKTVVRNINAFEHEKIGANS